MSSTASICGNGDGGANRAIHLEFTSDPANIATARKAVETLGCQCGFDEGSWGELGLVVNEALANIIRHAYQEDKTQPIDLEARFSGDELHIQLRDWGNGVNPAAMMMRPHDPLRPGGLGLICLRQFMDSVEYLPQPDGMILKMSRRLSHPRCQCSDTRSVG